MKPLIIYLLIINAISFLLMLTDKHKAKKRRYRIPESVLLGSAAIGGSLGSLVGMYLVRHKTKKARFYVGIPVSLIIQILFIIIIHV